MTDVEKLLTQIVDIFVQVKDSVSSLFSEIQKQRSSKVGVFEIPMTSANTEYPWQIPLGTKRFTMQCRDSTDVRIATVRGVVAASLSPYLTMKGGTAWDETDLDIKSLDVRLYFACGVDAKTVEVIAWT